MNIAMNIFSSSYEEAGTGQRELHVYFFSISQLLYSIFIAMKIDVQLSLRLKFKLVALTMRLSAVLSSPIIYLKSLKIYYSC